MPQTKLLTMPLTFVMISTILFLLLALSAAGRLGTNAAEERQRNKKQEEPAVPPAPLQMLPNVFMHFNKVA